MSYLAQLQSAATTAQNILAQFGGMSASSSSNATLDGTPLIVVADASRRGEELMLGGRIVTLALTVSATLTQTIFQTVTPAEGMAVVYDSVTYKILSKEKDGLHWRFILGHVSQ